MCLSKFVFLYLMVITEAKLSYRTCTLGGDKYKCLTMNEARGLTNTNLSREIIKSEVFLYQSDKRYLWVENIMF